MTKPQTWGGRTAEERRAERQKRLVDAAFEIWGDGGWAAVTMRGVCARAGLIDRYFYESFADRDALLAAVWDQVRDETTTALSEVLVAAEPAAAPLDILRQAVSTIVVDFAAEPRRAQILFGDHAGSVVLEHRRQELLMAVTNVIIEGLKPYLRAGVDDAEFRRTVLMAVGGTLELIPAWRVGAVEANNDEIIDQITHFGEILGTYYLPKNVSGL